MTNSDGLSIYKASAGSGKTYRLVGDFLEKLFLRPSTYKHMLAVTFTNKATAEMKERILLELASISQGQPSRYPELLEICGSEQLLKEKASEILSLILHDYSRFSIMTIDSFFQRIIRSFARDIRLNASFRTEIDNRQILSDAVDLLFQDLEENSLLMNWMISFLEDNLAEGRSWDFRKELLRFGKEVEKEAFKIHGNELVETLSGKGNLHSYIADLKGVLEESEILLKALGEKGLQMIGDAAMSPDQFKGGRNSFASLFVKLAAGRFDPPTRTMTEALDNLQGWSKQTDTPAAKAKIASLFETGLNAHLRESLQSLQQQQKRMNSARAILKNIYPLGLLGNISMKVGEVLKGNNTILLSDSGRMIASVIDGNDAPFIYEKVGLVYRHFMLDEFQDTSRQQWTNFKPLVENALASGNSSLVVGDVKQSIYRWRNGDWNLLANQIKRDLGHQQISEFTLDTNRRSRKNIVEFNNLIFRQAPVFLDGYLGEEMSEEPIPAYQGVITSAYSGNFQHVHRSATPHGLVQLTFVDFEGKRKGEFRTAALEHLLIKIEEAQLAGVKPDEMTILVRENAEAETIARALWEKKKNNPVDGCFYDVITSDTLKIGQSVVVKFIIGFFRFFTGKDQPLVRAELILTYETLLLPLIKQDRTWPVKPAWELISSDYDASVYFGEWLKAEDNKEFVTDMLSLPLYQLAVRILERFDLGKITGEKIYLQSFLDMVLEYGREAQGGLSGFLEWWDNGGAAKTVNLTTVRNFIRISTIHQSKGLEYPTVFVPFCNWELALNRNKTPNLWAFPEVEPFNQMKMVLLKCDANLRNSYFSKNYYEEFMLSIMDNLNLLYVAFTRAVDHLFVICPWNEEIKKVTQVGEMLQQLLLQPLLPVMPDEPGYADLYGKWNAATKVMQWGELVKVENQPHTDPPPVVEPLNLTFDGKKMGIRIHGQDYFQLSENNRGERINRGNLMHKILEKVKSFADLETAADFFITSGQVSGQEGAEVFRHLAELLGEAGVSEWFDGSWKVLNERDILRGGKSRHRPDRVMFRGDQVLVIDYKTGEISEKDLKQMKGYLEDIRSMGYSNCSGRIWYLEKHEIVEVER
ncbi:MAG: UvrD-helicase domain-containing protein [Marinilabiliales bacterium]|nr:UvrD-helicase domain-containing protein [Marinilabiliales bacterium]